MMKCLRPCVSLGMNFEQGQVHWERRSEYEKPLGKAAQPTEFSISRAYEKSQDKIAAPPEIRMDTVLLQAQRMNSEL